MQKQEFFDHVRQNVRRNGTCHSAIWAFKEGNPAIYLSLCNLKISTVYNSFMSIIRYDPDTVYMVTLHDAIADIDTDFLIASCYTRGQYHLETQVIPFADGEVLPDITQGIGFGLVCDQMKQVEEQVKSVMAYADAYRTQNAPMN